MNKVEKRRMLAGIKAEVELRQLRATLTEELGTNRIGSYSDRLREILSPLRSAPSTKRKVILSFSVSKDYLLSVDLKLPHGCTPGQLMGMIETGEIDWLKEINSQHDSSTIEEHGNVEHRELLSIDLGEESVKE